LQHTQNRTLTLYNLDPAVSGVTVVHAMPEVNVRSRFLNSRVCHLDMDLQLSERRIDELVAAFAVFGDRLTDVRGNRAFYVIQTQNLLI
jgi:hypothetical protein